jgi:hypothetical protein
MAWGRKGALMMLATVLLWTAAPAFACLPGMRAAGPADCCRSMAPDCPMSQAAMNASCCSTHRQDNAVPPVPFYAPEHAQKLFVTAHSASFVALANSDSIERAALLASPPYHSPGASSILRI